MADLDQLQSALIKADAAGDTAGAKILAGEIMRVRSAPPPEVPTPEPMDADARLQKMLGNPPPKTSRGSMAMSPSAQRGSIDNLIGAAGLVSKVLPESMANSVDEKIKANEKAFQDSRGDDAGKFDPQRLAGNVLSPFNILAATKIPVAATALGRIAQGVGIGAGNGALQPVTEGDDFWTQKAKQVGIGAAIGGAVPLTVEGVKAAGRLVKPFTEPMTESGRAEILKRFQTDKLLGGDDSAKANVIATLQGAKPIVPGSNPTAGEAIAEIPEATGLAAHQKIIAKTPGVSPQFATREAEQEAARKAAIQTVGKTPQELEAAIAARNAATAPMRETALANANIAGVKVPELTERLAGRQQSVADALQQKGQLETLAQQQTNRGEYYKTYPTAAVRSPRAPAEQFTENAADASAAARTATDVLGNRKAERDMTSYMLDSIEAHGLKPLQADTVVKSIDKIASQPGLRASDVVSKSLGEVRDKVASLADKNGVIDSRDLYMIRKEIGNTIQKFASENKNFDQRLTSGLQKQVQSHIDDAIEGAGGAGWKEYLTKYADMSKPINEMQVGQYLEGKLTNPLETGERASVFANAVKDAPGTIKRATGAPRFDDLGQVLSPQNKTVVDAIMDDLQRKAAFTRNASQTNLPGGSSLHEAGDVRLPNMLSRPAMVANFVMKRLGEGADAKINQLATKQYLNPQVLADALKDVPKNQQGAVVSAILQRLVTGAGTSAVAGQGER